MLQQIITGNEEYIAFLGKYAILIIISTIAWIMAVFQFTESFGLVNASERKINIARMDSNIIFIVWTALYFLLGGASDVLHVDWTNWYLWFGGNPSQSVIDFVTNYEEHIITGFHLIYILIMLITYSINLVTSYIAFKKNNSLASQILFLASFMYPLLISKIYFFVLNHFYNI